MENQKSILFIECDSMDGRIMGCQGHPAAHTPNMDALAKRGVHFAHTYCNSPQCCPSRASRWSGKHNHVIEAWNNYKGLEEGARTYVSDLEAAGYDGIIEENMVFCVESYLGDEAGGEGVKLEEQVLVTERGAEILSRSPFDDRLLA